MPKRSPEDILRDIEESDAEEAADRAASMTPGERRKELEAAGVDVNELHAKADDWHDRMQRAAREQRAGRLDGEDRQGRRQAPSGRGRVVVLVAAAAMAAALLGLLVIPRSEKDTAPAPPSPKTDAAGDAGAAPQRPPGDAAAGDAAKSSGNPPPSR